MQSPEDPHIPQSGQKPKEMQLFTDTDFGIAKVLSELRVDFYIFMAAL